MAKPKSDIAFTDFVTAPAGDAGTGAAYIDSARTKSYDGLQDDFTTPAVAGSEFDGLYKGLTIGLTGQWKDPGFAAKSRFDLADNPDFREWCQPPPATGCMNLYKL